MIIGYMYIKLKGPEFKERYECVIISYANRLLKEYERPLRRVSLYDWIEPASMQASVNAFKH